MDRILDLQIMEESPVEGDGNIFLCSTCSDTSCPGTTCTDTCGGTSEEF